MFSRLPKGMVGMELDPMLQTTTTSCEPLLILDPRSCSDLERGTFCTVLYFQVFKIPFLQLLGLTFLYQQHLVLNQFSSESFSRPPN